MHAKQCKYIIRKKTSLASFRYCKSSSFDSSYHLRVFLEVELQDDAAQSSHTGELEQPEQLQRDNLDYATLH